MTLAHTDLTLAERANAFAIHHDGWEDAARAYGIASEPLFVLVVAAIVAAGLLLKRRALILAGLLALAASGIAVACAHVVSMLVDRPRPFVAHPQIHAFIHHAADASFPSDHTTAAFAIAVVLVGRLGWPAVPALVAALALAASRVLTGLHYPGDVLAGALIGTAAAVLVCALASRSGRPLLRPVPV